MTGYNSDELERLEPAYLANYGLQEAPFAPQHHDKFLFIDAERAQRLNMLQHMVRYSNLLLIVQGESGVGKTALMQRFIHNAEPNWQLCEVTANTMIDADQLLFQAAQGFGVRELPQNAAELQELLYARIATFHRNEQIPVLLIDDAHLLPRDALLAIFNLVDAYVDDVNLLRVILFAEPQINKILNSKDVKVLAERVTHSMEIPPFNEEATAEYLKHRLAAAGFNGGSPFTPRMIKKIYRGSTGIPARINQLAHDMLEDGDTPSAEEPPEVNADPAMRSAMNFEQQRRQAKPVVFTTIAVLVVVFILVFQDTINGLFEEPTATDSQDNAGGDSAQTSAPPVTGERLQQPIDLQEKIIPLSEAPATATPETPDTAREGEVSTEKTMSVKLPATQDTVNAGQTPTDSVQPENRPADSAPVPPAPAIVRIASLEPDPVSTSASQQTLTLRGEGFSADSGVIIGWTGREKTLSPTQVRVVDDKEIQIAITVGLNEDTWSLQVISPSQLPAGQKSQVRRSNRFEFKVVDKHVDEGYRRDHWLLAQEPGNFTLQLFGTNRKANADQFIDQHKLKGQAGYFQTRRKGADWFSVVYGNYTSQDNARRAIKQLPATLARIKPWVRRMDDIQASINATRKQAPRTKKTTSARPVRPPQPDGTTGQQTSAKVNVDETQNESWIWSQDPRHFTLQLLGARSARSIQQFLTKYKGLNGKAVFFYTRHDQRDWYTVIYGVYTDRESANRAIKRLPEELQGSSPWIRSFGSIHAELARTE